MRRVIVLLIFLLTISSAFSKAVFDTNQYNKLNITDMGFRLACSAGLVAGCKVIRKFAVNDGLVLNQKKDVWDYGSVAAGNINYTYPADGTAPIDTMSSSNALDTQPVIVSGLDINGTDTDQIVTLNGQNKVTLSPSLWRIYRLINRQVETTADRTKGFNGEVYTYEDTAIVAGVPTDTSKVRAYVFDGNNQTQMSHYTIPDGFVGFLVGGSAKLDRVQATTVKYQLWIRNYGGVFRLVDSNALNTQGTGSFLESTLIPSILQPKTDFVICAESSASNTGIAVAYNIILLDKAIFGL